MNAGLIGAIFDAADKVHNNVRNDIISGYNIFNSEWQKDMSETQNRWAYADSRAANEMMNYYLHNGSLDGFKSWDNFISGQDYNDVADYLNPFLSLSSLDLSQKAQQLSEDQFKYSKYVTENAAQIRVNDLKKSGLSPLLAYGNGASYSPVGFASSGVSGNTARNRPAYSNLSSVGGTSAGAPIAQSFLAIEQAKKIKAETRLLNEQSEKTSEDIKMIKAETDLISEKIESTKAGTQLTKSQVKFISQQTADLKWNYDLAVDNGLKTFEDTPYLVKNIQNIISGVGVNVNSEIGEFLTSLLLTGIILRGEKVKFGKHSSFSPSRTLKAKESKK